MAVKSNPYENLSTKVVGSNQTFEMDDPVETSMHLFVSTMKRNKANTPSQLDFLQV